MLWGKNKSGEKIRRRHGTWPLYVPPAEPSEEWTLAELATGPLVTGLCKCHAKCFCDQEPPKG